MKAATYAIPPLLLASALLLPSCNVKYDMVSFNAVGITPASKSPIPRVEIDTNVTAGMMGGAVKSHKPYDIRAYYMDDTFTFASAEFTKVTVTYADGTVDAGNAALNLPKRFNASDYESHNSMAGGAVVVNKSRIIRAEFADTVSRDQPFTLQIEGHFTKDNGTIIPFKIKQNYDISHEKRTESWVDFIGSC